jgi:L-fuculose-phosphate aldolase
MSHVLPGLTEQLAEVGADAVHRGLVLASAGNLSAMLPSGDRFVVTATGTWLDDLTHEDWTVMSMEGAIVSGNPAPSSEWRLHWRTYQARPDVRSVIHLHPQMAVLLDAMGHGIRLVNQDHVVYLRRVVRVPYLMTGTDELALAVAEAARTSDAVILAHHGCSTTGETVRMAYRRALNLEEAAQNTFHLLQLGDTTTTFPPELAEGLQHL